MLAITLPMRIASVLSFFAVLLAVAPSSAFSKVADQQMIMGYVSVWGLKAHDVLANINPNLITHLSYAFLDIDENNQCVLLNEDKDEEEESDATHALVEFKNLKTRFPQIKTILSIGGYGNSKYYSDVASTPSARKVFAKSCIEFLKQYSFDGIDLDWEFPVTGGVVTNHMNPHDTQNQVLLVREFRKQLNELQKSQANKTQYSLSMAISGEKRLLHTSDVKKLAPFIDWFGVMAYDMCADRPCNHSSLYSYDSDHSYTQETIQAMLKEGVKTRQIVLGVPFYGYSWQNVNGVYTRNFIDYPVMMSSTAAYTKVYDKIAKQPWLISPDQSIKINYDDEASLHNKAQYAKKHHLAGTLIWELTSDDDQFTLLKALNESHD